LPTFYERYKCRPENAGLEIDGPKEEISRKTFVVFQLIAVENGLN